MNEAERAKSLLGDEFFMGVVEKQRLLYIRNILNSAEDDVEFRERSLLKHRALDDFIATLESIAAQTEIDKRRWKIF